MKRDAAFYRARGFDARTADYFAAGRRTVTQVTANPDYTLTLCFDNGERRLFDVAPLLLPGTVFEPLADRARFARVYLDDTHSVAWDIDPAIDSREVWNNKIDLSSDTCYLDSRPLA